MLHSISFDSCQEMSDIPHIATTFGHIGSPSLVFLAISSAASAINSPPILLISFDQQGDEKLTNGP